MEPTLDLKSVKNQKNRSTERFECQMVPRTAPGTVRREKGGAFWSLCGRKWRPEGRSRDRCGVQNGARNRVTTTEKGI